MSLSVCVCLSHGVHVCLRDCVRDCACWAGPAVFAEEGRRCGRPEEAGGRGRAAATVAAASDELPASAICRTRHLPAACHPRVALIAGRATARAAFGQPQGLVCWAGPERAPGSKRWRGGGLDRGWAISLVLWGAQLPTWPRSGGQSHPAGTSAFRERRVCWAAQCNRQAGILGGSSRTKMWRRPCNRLNLLSRVGRSRWEPEVSVSTKTTSPGRPRAKCCRGKTPPPPAGQPGCASCCAV